MKSYKRYYVLFSTPQDVSSNGLANALRFKEWAKSKEMVLETARRIFNYGGCIHGVYKTTYQDDLEGELLLELSEKFWYK